MSLFTKYQDLSQSDKDFLQSIINDENIYDHCCGCDHEDPCSWCKWHHKRNELLEKYKGTLVEEIAKKLMSINYYKKSVKFDLKMIDDYMKELKNNYNVVSELNFSPNKSENEEESKEISW